MTAFQGELVTLSLPEFGLPDAERKAGPHAVYLTIIAELVSTTNTRTAAAHR